MIVLRKAAMWGEDGDDEDTTLIAVPVQLMRHEKAVRLVVGGPEEDRAKAPNPRLAALLWKAQRRCAAQSSGAQPSVLAIARETGLESSDITRAVYLAFLAPDIVSRILDGDHAAVLGTKKLLAMAPLPLDWGEQRRVLGLTG